MGFVGERVWRFGGLAVEDPGSDLGTIHCLHLLLGLAAPEPTISSRNWNLDMQA